jgi:hypothetical protein
MLKKTRKKFKLVFCAVAALLILVGATFLLADFGKEEKTPSVELILNSFSPNGSQGGVMIPASCESGYTENSDHSCTLNSTCTSGEWVWDSNTCSVDNCVNGQWVNSGECSNFGDGSDPSQWCACDYNCNYLKSGSYSNPNCCTSNGSCSAATPACNQTTWGVDNCGNSCSLVGDTPDNCAANTCQGDICWDNCNWMSGSKDCCISDGSCSAAEPACGKTTWGVDNCWDSCSKTGETCCVSNGSCSAAEPACEKTTWGEDNCGNSCSLVGDTPDNCASTIYTDQTCWNNCDWVSGTLTRPIVCNDCASGTCEGDACWNGCEWASGTAFCDNGCADYTSECTDCWNSYEWTQGLIQCNRACVNGACAVDNGCAANTCTDQVCWNSYMWVSGTKVCSGECVDYPNPIENEPTSLCNAGTASSIDENASNWEWTCTLSGGTDNCAAEKDCGDTTYTFVYNENAADLCAEGACGISKDATYVCIKTTENCGSSTVANDLCGTPHPASVACPACPKGSRWKEIAD